MIVCPECGNNCCNGGRGPLTGPDAGTCPICPLAYDYEEDHWGERPLGFKSLILRVVQWVFETIRLLVSPKRLKRYIEFYKIMHS